MSPSLGAGAPTAGDGSSLAVADDGRWELKSSPVPTSLQQHVR